MLISDVHDKLYQINIKNTLGLFGGTKLVATKLSNSSNDCTLKFHFIFYAFFSYQKLSNKNWAHVKTYLLETQYIPMGDVNGKYKHF